MGRPGDLHCSCQRWPGRLQQCQEQAEWWPSPWLPSCPSSWCPCTQHSASCAVGVVLTPHKPITDRRAPSSLPSSSSLHSIPIQSPFIPIWSPFIPLMSPFHAHLGLLCFPICHASLPLLSPPGSGPYGLDSIPFVPNRVRCPFHSTSGQAQPYLHSPLCLVQPPVCFISPFDVLNLLLSSVFGLILSLCILIAYIPGGSSGTSSLLTSTLLSLQCVYNIPRAHCILQENVQDNMMEPCR